MTYFICYKNCKLHWLIFEFELEHQQLLSNLELQTSEDLCATNLNPPINRSRSRQQGFVAGSPSLKLT